MRTVRFELDATVPLAEARLTLDLARYSAEGLVGQARVRLDVVQRLDSEGHAIVVEGEGEALESVVRVYAALLIREFGETAFRTRTEQAGEPAAEATYG